MYHILMSTMLRLIFHINILNAFSPTMSLLAKFFYGVLCRYNSVLDITNRLIYKYFVVNCMKLYDLMKYKALFPISQRKPNNTAIVITISLELFSRQHVVTRYVMTFQECLILNAGEFSSLFFLFTILL